MTETAKQDDDDMPAEVDPSAHLVVAAGGNARHLLAMSASAAGSALRAADGRHAEFDCALPCGASRQSDPDSRLDPAAATSSDGPPSADARRGRFSGPGPGPGDVVDALLRRLAWLAPEAIPDSLLDTPMPAASDEAAAAPSGALRAALSELERRALVRRADDGRSLCPLPPVQAESRHRQRDTARQSAPDGVPPALRAALLWVDAAFVGEAQDVRDWPRLDPLAPHAQAVAAFADAAAIAAPTSRLLGDAGLLLLEKACYVKAEALLRRALAIAEASLGGEHPDVARDLSNLARLLKDTNRLAEAERLLRRALAIDEASFGSAHPEVAIDLNNLAQLLQATHRLAEAEALLHRALAIAEASQGGDHPQVACDLNNLAQLLQNTDRLAEAEPLMRRALAIDEASFGSAHPEVAIDLNNLALLLQATNRLAEAEPLLRRALAIDGASLGAEHPAVARDLNNLARLLQDRNRLAEAEPLQRRALRIFVRSLGDEHPHTQGVRQNAVHLLRALGRSEDEIVATLDASPAA